MPADLHELARLARDVAREAGAVLLDGLAAGRTAVETKSTRTDMVTEMDRASEDLIAEAIRAARPGDGFLGEEGTATAATAAGDGGGVRWIVDPLDGTTNYLYRFPVWAVSVAAEVDGEVAVGVVYDPTHDELFEAVVHEGARHNGHTMLVGGAPDLATALVGTGFSYDAAERGRQAALLAHVLPAVRDVRRSGAAALDLCWVGLGRLDAFYERGLKPWDLAAGSLIASEAGASCVLLEDGTCLAAAPQLFDPLVRLLGAAPPG